MLRKSIVLGLGITLLAIAAGTWRLHATRVQPPLTSKIGQVPSVFPPSTVRGDSARTIVGQPVMPIDPRTERNKARDYRELVKLLLPLAKAGSPTAQYELASALHHCDESWHQHFFSRSTGAERTPEEMRQLNSKLSENTRRQLDDAYQRCHSFSDNLSLLNGASDWLDEAVKAGYPPATFMKADLTLKTLVMKGGSAAAIEQVRQQAISATMSADPDVLFGMADFVDGADKTREQTGQLISAWWLLGCQSGYDCSADSDAIEGVCTVDPQCADRPTIVEQLQRVNGAKFEEVQQLAEQIKAAIESGDPLAVKKYL
jgi:hypothetical protein